MPAGVWRLAVLLVLLVPDIVVLSMSAPLDEARPIDEATQRELDARKEERRARFNRRGPDLEARMPKPVGYDPNPSPVVVKGVAVRGPQPGALAAGEPAGTGGTGGPPDGGSEAMAPRIGSGAEVGPVTEDGGGVAAAAPDLGRAWVEGEVVQPDGSAVSWLEVRLLARADRSVVASTVTDHRGGYRFADVSRGEYQVEFGPAGAPLGELDEELEIRSGEHRRDWQTPRLGGLKVRVSADDGARPLVGRQVRIQERFGEERQGVTDDEGLAHFRNLPVGSYRVLLIEDGVRQAEERQAVVAKATTSVELGSDIGF